MRRTVMDTECNINQCMDKYPYTISLDIATTLIEVLSEDTTIFSEQFRQCMIEKINGKLATHRVINDVDAILPAGPVHGKQTMMYPENYFTEAIWRGLLDDEASKADVYICKSVLFLCGAVSSAHRKPSGAYSWPHCNGLATIPNSIRLK